MGERSPLRSRPCQASQAKSDEVGLIERASFRPARFRPPGACLSVSVSVSIHPGTTPPPRRQPSLHPQDSEHRTGRERVGMDLESASALSRLEISLGTTPCELVGTLSIRYPPAGKSRARLALGTRATCGFPTQPNRVGASAAGLTGMSGGGEPPMTMAAPRAANAGADSIPEPPWPAKK